MYIAVLVLDEALVVISDVVGAGITAVVGSEMVVAMGGSGGETGGWWMSWEQWGGVGCILGLRWESWGEQGRFVKCVTHSDERICMASCSSVFWAADSLRVLFTAWVLTSRVSLSFRMLDMAWVIVLEAGIAGVAIDIISDVTVEQQGLGCEKGGWGSCWGFVS